MITYFSFEPAKNYNSHPLGKSVLFTDFKGRIVIPGEAVFSTDKNTSLKVKSAYAIATSNGWQLMNQNDYGIDINSLIQNELNDICPKALQSFE